MSAPPATETMKISDHKQKLNGLVNCVYHRQTRIIVEKRGIPVAGIVSIQDLRHLDQRDRERKERSNAIKEFSAGCDDQTPEEIERDVARAISEVRAEQTAAAR